MHRVIQVGCGRVVRERIIPAARALAKEGILSICHVVDVVPRDQVEAALQGLLPTQAVYHQIAPTHGELERLLQRDELRAQPVIVATPTNWHAEHACAALTCRHPVALEKPLAHTIPALDEISACLAQSDPRLLFPFGYYLIEKGLPLLALARRGAMTPTQMCCLAGLQPEEWAELRDRLGAVSAMTALIREGPDPRSWVVANEVGGHTLETFSHLIAMALPWVERLAVKEAVLARTLPAPSGQTENLVAAELTGPRGERIRLACEKWCDDHALGRWTRIECEHGSVLMDLETERLTIQLPGLQKTAATSARLKYEPQLRMFAAKIDNPDEPTEYEIGCLSVQLSLAVRELGLRHGVRTSHSRWLDRWIAGGTQ